MIGRTGEAGQTRTAEHLFPSALASVIALLTYPVAVLLVRIWRRPAFYFGLLATLSVTLLGSRDTSTLAIPLPPIIPISAVFGLLALAKGGMKRVFATLRASPAMFWTYALVCLVETFSMVYHARPGGWTFVAGRCAFFIVFLVTVALCEGTSAVNDVLRAITYGAAIIGLLTIVHALRIWDVPVAWGLDPSRTFGPIKMPIPRTLGVAMSHNKFGIMAGVALATVILSAAVSESTVSSRWLRVLLFVLILAGCAITQTRAVYLTVVLVLAVSVCFLVGGRRINRWLGKRNRSWFVALAYAALLVVANVLFPYVVPDALVDVGTAQSARNVSARIEMGALGWLHFSRAPLLGIGHGAIDELTFDDTGIHNHLLEQFVSTGLVGGIPYLLFHMLVLVTALRLLEHPPLWTGTAARVLVVGVVATLFAYQFFPGFFVSTFAVLGGLVASLARQRLDCERDMRPTWAHTEHGLTVRGPDCHGQRMSVVSCRRLGQGGDLRCLEPSWPVDLREVCCA